MKASSSSIKKALASYIVTKNGATYIKDIDNVKKFIFNTYENVGCLIEEKTINGKKVQILKIVSAKSFKVFAEYIVLLK